MCACMKAVVKRDDTLLPKLKGKYLLDFSKSGGLIENLAMKLATTVWDILFARPQEEHPDLLGHIAYHTQIRNLLVPGLVQWTKELARAK